MKHERLATSDERQPVVPIRTLTLLTIALLLSATSFATLTPDDKGRIRQGPHVFYLDDDGGLAMRYKDVTLFNRGGLFGDHKGKYIKFMDCADKKVVREKGKTTFSFRVPNGSVRFVQTTSIEEGKIRVEIVRHGAWSEDEWISYQILLPRQLYGKGSYVADGVKGSFPAAYKERSLTGTIKRLELKSGNKGLDVAFESENWMGLGDMRHFNEMDFWSVGIGMDRAGESASVAFYIIPPDTGESSAALRLSRIGYPVSGEKLAVLEWAPGEARPDDRVSLEKKGGGVVKQGKFSETKPFMALNQASFDFSEVKEAGDYRVKWSGGVSDFFPIKAQVFKDKWQMTLDSFLPWQMCHLALKNIPGAPDRRACHMDDGMRVPANFPGIDGFKSYDCGGTPYKEGDFISCGVGGWHDAGDNDLNVSAQAHSLLRMALAYEEFGLERDVATLDTASRVYYGKRPDGVPDILQQIEWAAYWLLSVQQKDGRVYLGVVHQPKSYGAGVAPEDTTDNKKQTGDERHVYVDYHPDSQLKATMAFCAASRVLARHQPELAGKCLNAARWAYHAFKTYKEEYRTTGYFKNDPRNKGRDQMVSMTLTELYLTTGLEEYLKELEKMADAIAAISITWPSPDHSTGGNFWYAPPYLARLYPRLEKGTLKDAVHTICEKAARDMHYEMENRPWPFYHYYMYKWGQNGRALNYVFDCYWLSKMLPQEIDMSLGVAYGLWIFGLHPLNDYAFVCGITKEFPRYLYSSGLHARYGAAPSHVPGAVVPGIGGSQNCEIWTYADRYGEYHSNEACIYTAAELIFAMSALTKAGY